MMRFFATFLLVFIVWVVLTLSFSVQELAVGAAVALLIAGFSGQYLFHRAPEKVLNPVRWLRLLVYFAVFLGVEIKCHLDLFCRIVTGRINPAVVKVKTGFRTDIGKTLLGNSITLTPGTLTIDAGKDLLVHWIAFDEKKRIGRVFEKFGKGVTE